MPSKKLKISDSLNIEDINFIQKTKEYQNALDKLLLYLEEKFMFKNNYEVRRKEKSSCYIRDYLNDAIKSNDSSSKCSGIIK